MDAIDGCIYKLGSAVAAFFSSFFFLVGRSAFAGDQDSRPTRPLRAGNLQVVEALVCFGYYLPLACDAKINGTLNNGSGIR